MTWTNLIDVRCYYEVIGRGDPLLLVPGLGVTSSVWDAAVPLLAARHSLILVDNRGIGRSEPLRPVESLGDYAADLLELMDYLQLDRAHVLGLSLGGMIARKFAADHPSRVDRLVLISCTDQCPPYLRQMMRLIGGILRKLPPEAFYRTIETLGTSPEFFDAHTDLFEQQVRHKTRHTNHRAVARQLRCLAREAESDIPSATVTVPTLVIAGEYDPLVPACYARAMADRIPGSQFMTVKGAGHNPLTECPEDVVPQIVDFLTQDNPTGRSLVAGARRAGTRPTQHRKEGAGRVAIVE